MAAYDIKLALDVESQELITSILLEAFPDHAIFGEEGIAGNQDSRFQWIVDPIDGTVNYFYGIPHFCISIALREDGELKTGVIYDPMLDELWAVEKGGAPTLNGTVISHQPAHRLSESVSRSGSQNPKRASTLASNASKRSLPESAQSSASWAARRSPWPTSPAAASTPTSKSRSACGTSPPASCSSKPLADRST